jgi:hypothetical protein
MVLFYVVDNRAAEAIVAEQRIPAAKHEGRFTTKPGEIEWSDLPGLVLIQHGASVCQRVDEFAVCIKDIQFDCKLPIQTMSCAGQAWVVCADRHLDSVQYTLIVLSIMDQASGDVHLPTP